MAKTRRFRKGGTLSKETAATKLQSLNRGKTTRKHTKRLELYKKLPDDLQSIIDTNTDSVTFAKKLLLKSIKKNDIKTTKYILDKGLHINISLDKDGRTALHYSSAFGHTKIVEYLIKKGADVNAKNNNILKHNYKWTPLHEATSGDHAGVVKLLLENGAQVDEKDGTSATPLLMASKYGRTEIVKLLLENGADVYVKDDEGKPVLHWASLYGHKEVVKALLKFGAKDDEYYSEETMRNIISDDSVEELKVFEDLNVYFDNDWGYTPLMHASSEGSIEIVKYIIKDSDSEYINQQNEDGWTALDYANRYGRTEIIELLEKAQKIKEKEEEEKYKQAQKKLIKSRTPKYKDRRRKVKPDFDRRRRGGKGGKTRRH